MAQLARGRIAQAHQRELSGPAAALYAEQGIRSLICVPVQVDDRFWGFLGFDESAREREWTTAEIEALRAAAGALGAAIQRHLSDERERDLERRYRSLVEQLPVTTYIERLDDQMVPIFISPQIEEVLGYSVDEWMTDPALITRILHPDDRASVLDTTWPEDDGPHRYEYRLFAKDGREVWFLDEYTIVRDEAGKRLYAQGYMVDITERKRMEEELRRTNELLRTVVQASPLAIIVTDLDDRVTFWNPAAERIYGWTSEEALGTRPATRSPDQDDEYRWFRETCDRGQWISGFETERLRKDGATIVVSISLAPLHDASGKLVGLFGIHEDITERKRSEDALRESEQHFRAVFDVALDGMAIYDDERRYVQVNEALARMHGRPREEFAGRRIDEFVVPELLPMLDDLWETLLREGVITGEAEVPHVSGERRAIEYTVRAGFLPGRHLAVVRDVTERRQLEAHLLQSQRLEAVGRLAGGVAHDFNNLLTAISGYSEFLLEALSDAEPLRHDVEEIRRASDRAAALVRQLLAFSRRQLLRPRVVDLNEVISETETMLRRLIGEDVELVTELEPALSPIRADPVQLEQIVVNLAVNARDAMPDGGTLSIRTEAVDGGRGVGLTVSDTGIGMDADTIAHAFEPFFTTKEQGKGTGLGLSTVYGIVAQSGGTIEVRSEPGQGATFTVVLPAYAGPLSPPVARPERAPDSAASEQVLLVEDDAVVRDLTERVLGSSGYRVLSAASGDEACALADSLGDEIALLMTDLVMPGMSGRELARRLTERRPGLRVLFTSGYTDDDDVALAGARSGFIGKPFTPDALRQKVRELLDARPG
jgi:PAS domain S-box-containing protein